MANYRWDDENPLILYIEITDDGLEEKINLDTKGVAYAAQFGALTSWLGRNALPALMTASDSGQLEGTDIDVAVSLLTNIMDLGFSPDSMIELAAILINKDQAFVEEYFDPGWFIEALMRSFDYRQGVKTAFLRLYERFLVGTPANTGDEEG